MPMMPYSPATKVPTRLCAACPYAAICLALNDPDEAWMAMGGDLMWSTGTFGNNRLIPLAHTHSRAAMKRMRCYQRGYHLPAHMRTKGV